MAHRPVVMLVDDDAAMRTLLCTIFDVHGGFRIGGVAGDGLEGALLAADVNPDVVVLDFFMPRWDGSRAAEFIRQHCPNTKIIAFSAVLTEAPDWADTFLLKTHIDELTGVVESLAA
ncbi:MAG: hypothetical protein QOC87_1066 [Actinomycetota bacterium]|nr:hypothetical protein [Actinomycetota bacterium]